MTYSSLRTERDLARDEAADLARRHADVVRLCQRYAHSGVNLETHKLAHAVLKLLEQQEPQRSTDL